MLTPTSWLVSRPCRPQTLMPRHWSQPKRPKSFETFAWPLRAALVLLLHLKSNSKILKGPRRSHRGLLLALGVVQITTAMSLVFLHPSDFNSSPKTHSHWQLDTRPLLSLSRKRKRIGRPSLKRSAAVSSDPSGRCVMLNLSVQLSISRCLCEQVCGLPMFACKAVAIQTNNFRD